MQFFNQVIYIFKLILKWYKIIIFYKIKENPENYTINQNPIFLKNNNHPPHHHLGFGVYPGFYDYATSFFVQR